MACFSPLSAWRSECGEIVFRETRGALQKLELPCGQCIGCRLERSRQWAVRCMHESQMHAQSSFVTLTYNEENYKRSLEYRDFQLFAKRLRRKMGPFRFYMCGEYGEQQWRPHYHACLFGVWFDDRVLHQRLGSGFNLYRSSVLSALWPFGFSSIGDVTFESAAYVARYITKKVTGARADEHYTRMDVNTGEVFKLEPEFTRMSLKPGIGASWLEKFRQDVFPRDYVVIRGVKCKVPKYYDTLNREHAPRLWTDVEFQRMQDAESCWSDSTDDRLRTRAIVAKARLTFKKRTLE